MTSDTKIIIRKRNRDNFKAQYKIKKKQTLETIEEVTVREDADEHETNTVAKAPVQPRIRYCQRLFLFMALPQNITFVLELLSKITIHPVSKTHLFRQVLPYF